MTDPVERAFREDGIISDAPVPSGAGEDERELIERLKSIMIPESPMHPIGCSTWELEAQTAVDMAVDYIEQAALSKPLADQGEGEAVAWHKGAPPHPWDKEWFIARLDNGDKVVLTALPEEYTYDFKTADETYYAARRIAEWAQFPDSHFVEFAHPAPQAGLTRASLVTILEDCIGAVSDDERCGVEITGIAEAADAILSATKAKEGGS